MASNGPARQLDRYFKSFLSTYALSAATFLPTLYTTHSTFSAPTTTRGA